MYYKLYFSTKYALYQQDLQKERVTPYNSRPVCPYNIGNSYLNFTARTRMFLIYNNIDVDIQIESAFYFNCLSSLKRIALFIVLTARFSNLILPQEIIGFYLILA